MVSLIKLIKQKTLYKKGPSKCLNSDELESIYGIKRNILYIREKEIYDKTDNEKYNDFIYNKIDVSFESLNPEVFILEFDSGKVWGDGAIITPDGENVIRDISVDFGNDSLNHYLIKNQYIKKPKYFKGRVGCAASKGSKTYYHWMFDVLPRVMLLLEHDKIDYLIVNTFGGRLQEILYPLLEAVKIIEPDEVSHYECEKLIVPSLVGYSGQPTSRACELILKAYQNTYRDIDSKSKNRFIYVSRNKAKGRNLIEEDSLVKELSKIGFTVVHLERMHWSEQIRIFSNASFIVAPHGAGLSNLIFCKEGTKVVEIFNPQYVHWCYWQLSSIRNLLYYPYIENYNSKYLTHSVSHCSSYINITISKLIEFIISKKENV